MGANELRNEPFSVRSPRDLIGRDPGLQARMLITLSLLALLYVVLGGVIIAAGGGLAVMVVEGCP